MTEEEIREPKVLDAEAEDPIEMQGSGLSGEAYSRPEMAPNLLAVGMSEETHSQVLPGYGVSADKVMESSQAPSVTKGRRDGAKNLSDFIVEEVGIRASRIDPKLKAQLSSVIQLELTDLHQSFVFDWQGNNLKIKEGIEPAAECCIAISSEDLLGIADGELNAQMAMLSDKVRVTGRVGVAMYFFNLFVK